MYYIDQSIKIENTSKTTYLALANSKQIVISISAKEKRTLKLVFRQLNKPLIFKLFTFSLLVAKVIEQVRLQQVTVDKEYPGHEVDIKNYITQLLLIAQKPVPQIYFQSIGKGNNAHLCAYNAHKNKTISLRISYAEVIKRYEQISL